MPHDKPATRKPIGGAIRNPPIALNRINENIRVFAKVTRLSLDFKKSSTFFITHQSEDREPARYYATEDFAAARG